jgi:transposase
LFRGKRGDDLKALYWDGSGLRLFAKPLEVSASIIITKQT